MSEREKSEICGFGYFASCVRTGYVNVQSATRRDWREILCYGMGSFELGWQEEYLAHWQPGWDTIHNGAPR